MISYACSSLTQEIHLHNAAYDGDIRSLDCTLKTGVPVDFVTPVSDVVFVRIFVDCRVFFMFTIIIDTFIIRKYCLIYCVIKLCKIAFLCLQFG